MEEDKPGSVPPSHIYEVIAAKVSALENLRSKRQKERTVSVVISDAITEFSGSMPFVYLHVLWFGLWIAFNVPLHAGDPAGLNVFGGKPFDPFPFGLLTMIVSLEAIFLATFVLISQNRMADEAEDRSELDLQIDLLAEHEVTHIIKMLAAICAKLGIEKDLVEDRQAFETEVDANLVLEEIRIIKADQRKLNKRRAPGIRQ